MTTYLKFFLSLFLIIFLLGAANFLPPALAVEHSDYFDLNNLAKGYHERLASQELKVTQDRDYLQEAVSDFEAQNAIRLQKAFELRLESLRCRQSSPYHQAGPCIVVFEGKELYPAEAESAAKDLEQQCSNCDKSGSQASKYLKTVSSRLSNIYNLQNNLGQWKMLHDKAAAEAMMQVVHNLFRRIGDVIATQAEGTVSLNGWLSRHQKKLIAAGINLPFLQSRLKQVHQKYLMAELAVKNVELPERMDPVAVWKMFEDRAGNLALALAQLNIEVRAVLDEPKIYALLQQDKPGLAISDIFSRNEVNEILKEYPFGQLLPDRGVAVLIRDSEYLASQWQFGIKLIVDGNDLTEKRFKADDALSSFIARKKIEWEPCLKGSSE